MKKWVFAAAAGAAAIGGAAAAVVLKKKKTSGGVAEGAKAGAKTQKNKQLSTGSYSFVSGFKDAKTVNITIDYDPSEFEFKVIEDEFLTYTSDSHVAVLLGEDFSMQLEYSDYYGSDDFGTLEKTLEEKFKGFEKLSYGDIPAYKYYDGDNVCICLPADEHSYLLVTAIPAKGSDIDYTELACCDAVKELLASVKSV